MASSTPTRSKKTTAKKGTVFTPVVPLNTLDFPALERTWFDRWQADGTMERYLNRNEDKPEQFKFIDGPITANNQMGVHHAWNRMYKDMYQRYHTMLGHRQRYQNGFDCQGLWVEVEVEKEFGFKSKRDIEEYGIAAFVERCKERVYRFADLITAQSKRLGYWMHWDNSYYTMSDENNYTIWHFLKTCHERGLIYKGRDVMPWCPRCATGISDMEINEGRREVQHNSLYVRFPLKDRPNEYLLVWTTTPWTLPANVAAAVNPLMTYAKVEQDGNLYYLSSEVVESLGSLKGHDRGEYRVVGTITGSEMVGWEYSGPFDELPAWHRKAQYAQGVTPSGDPLVHRVVPWSDVAATEGTGIVHIAPGCGREDFALGRAEGLRIIAPIDDSGTYVDGFDWLTGLFAGNIGKDDPRPNVARMIMDNLREKGVFYATRSYTHVYPHCWRCGTELLFRDVEEWFINMGPKDDPTRNGLRYEIMDVVNSIRWLPSFGLERELDWLRNMEDWMISKKRYWGLALPIFDCHQCHHFEVIGSETELHDRAVEGWQVFDGHSPHRPYVDAVKIRCSNCGELVERVKDVGNPWLDAGIVPFSTLKYREDRDYWREWYPANFITESFPGQFRNWFYSLLVMGTVLAKSRPFETVLGFASVLAFDGSLMSKSKGTATWFQDAAEIVGADVMRWMYAAQAPEQDVRFPPTTPQQQAQAAENPAKVKLTWPQVRETIDRLWNVYYFFVTYANIDAFDPATTSLPVSERADVDRWLLSELQTTIREVTAGLADFDSKRATDAISEFVDQLSNWYIRRVRRRFWKSEMDSDKMGAYLTLYEALVTLAKLMAPITPFLTEEMYTTLVKAEKDAPLLPSVHLSDWPVADDALVNADLQAETRLIQRVVNLGRAARETARIRVRQPLPALYVRVNETDHERLERLSAQVLDELNVKSLRFLDAKSDMLTASVRPKNMAALGQTYRAQMQGILAALKQVDAVSALAFQQSGTLELTLANGEHVALGRDLVDVVATAREGFVAAEDKGLVVVLETVVTPELADEGIVRDLTHHINTLRKKADFAIEETITTTLIADQHLGEVIERFADYVRDETLSRTLTVQQDPFEGNAVLVETIPAAKLGGHEVTIALAKVEKKRAVRKSSPTKAD